MFLKDLHLNESNPRQIKGEKFEKLKKSVKEFERMLELRPIVVDENNVILGGNMRYRALEALGYSEIPNEWVKRAEGLTEEQKREFLIKDNVGYGEWDFDTLFNEWDTELLKDWGVDLPIMTETEKLSQDITVNEDLYYTPIERESFELSQCVNTDKMNAKIKAIEEIEGLTDEQREVMKMFAYRFMRIDFQRVADYYFFQATEAEKRAMERLRLVLCDCGVQGFIEDDLLRIKQLVVDD